MSVLLTWHEKWDLPRLPRLLIQACGWFVTWSQPLDCGFFVKDSGQIYRDTLKDVILCKFSRALSQCLSLLRKQRATVANIRSGTESANLQHNTEVPQSKVKSQWRFEVGWAAVSGSLLGYQASLMPVPSVWIHFTLALRNQFYIILVVCRSSQIAIPVMSVTHIKKTKTAILVPNALVIATANDRVRRTLLHHNFIAHTWLLDSIHCQHFLL